MKKTIKKKNTSESRSQNGKAKRLKLNKEKL